MRTKRSLTVLALALAIATTIACGSSTSTSPPVDGQPAASGQVTIGPAGGSVEADGVRLDVPAGAVSSDVTISVTETSDPAPDGYTALSHVYAFSPDGLTFAVPATISIGFEGDPSEALVVWVSGASIEELSSRIEGSNMVAQVSHFSRGFVANRHHGGGGPDAGDDGSSGGGDSGGDAATDAPSDGGDASDGASCRPLNASCNDSAPCCAGGVCSTVGICLPVAKGGA